nr:hypothetical protein [Tanacetum cinerariifolium]
MPDNVKRDSLSQIGNISYLVNDHCRLRLFHMLVLRGEVKHHQLIRPSVSIEILRESLTALKMWMSITSHKIL